MKRNIAFYWRNRRKLNFFELIDALEVALRGCDSVLDVACGSSSPLRYIPKKFYAVGCDLFAGAIEKSRSEGIHDQYHQMDVLHLDQKFPPKSFDGVVALDFIEHLEKKEGLRFISLLEKIARKRVILLTPNGFLRQEAYGGNIHQVHRSGWTPDEMQQQGFKVIGLFGWKALRGEKGGLRFSPKTLWSVVSALTQVAVRNRPHLAFQMLCVKDLGDPQVPDRLATAP